MKTLSKFLLLSVSICLVSCHVYVNYPVYSLRVRGLSDMSSRKKVANEIVSKEGTLRLYRALKDAFPSISTQELMNIRMVSREVVETKLGNTRTGEIGGGSTRELIIEFRIGALSSSLDRKQISNFIYEFLGKELEERGAKSE